jgi:phosphatidylserine/phosphatidylglycerophosphate/cardiolipin synthase-like enzyme
MIDDADDTILIATTRLKLRPVFNALLRAAERGVKIKLVVTMGEYVHKSYRKKLDLPECPDEFHSSCSSGVNYSIHLSRENFPGSENVDVRLKFFHMNTKAYLDKQMHSKYMIIDNETIMTGSFNWSYSAEFKHVENIMEIDGYEYPEILLSFNSDFDELWDLERGLYKGLVADYERDLKKKKKIDCSFEPMTLKFSEIDFLLATPYRAAKKRSLKYVCK